MFGHFISYDYTIIDPFEMKQHQELKIKHKNSPEN